MSHSKYSKLKKIPSEPVSTTLEQICTNTKQSFLDFEDNIQ